MTLLVHYSDCDSKIWMTNADLNPPKLCGTPWVDSTDGVCREAWTEHKDRVTCPDCNRLLVNRLATMVTADTITDSQIRALLDRALHDKLGGVASKRVVRICKLALDQGVTHRTAAQLREARERCAAIYNNLSEELK